MSPSRWQRTQLNALGTTRSTFLCFLIQNLSRDDPNVKTLHLFSTEQYSFSKTDSGAAKLANHLHFNCPCRCSVGRAVADTKPHHLADSTAIGPIERDRKGWLQQTPSHSRNRIR